ncbi:alpha/beta fold hydrolase [Kitasatospora sp. NPDC053057]|uniref:alpha/beta fold hydrolase n=1 Tax=Kitasatospora sp. NPDC053057 TaxID=3364062 RepID=UPI0037CA5AAB
MSNKRNKENKANNRTARPLGEIRELIAEALAEHTPGGVRPGELDRGGRALRWVEAGSGEDVPIVLIAGCGDSSLTWAPLLPELTGLGRVVAYDRAGLGASEPDRAPTLSLDAPVEDLAALVRHLDAGPAVLVGHSWGGQLAQLMARQRPELVAGLVLVDPAHEEFRPRAIAVVEAALLRFALLRAALAPAAPDRDDALARAEAATVAHPHQRRAVLAEHRLTGLAVPVLRRRRADAALPEVPVAVLSATEGLPRALRTRFTAAQARIAAGAARSVHTEVSGAGHYIHADRPHVVAAAVREVSDPARIARNAGH